MITLFGTFYIIDLLFITPRIVGGRAGVAPLTVLLGIIAGGELFGLLGILLAIPGLAVAQILIVEMTAIYKRSSFYLGSVPEASSALSNDDTESL